MQLRIDPSLLCSPSWRSLLALRKVRRAESTMDRTTNCLSVMPIKPENKRRYPSNWLSEIRPAILARAGYACERDGCGARQYDVGIWSEDRRGRMNWVCEQSNETHALATQHKLIMADRWEMPRTIIVLTIAHLDHAPENCDPSNLRAFCQRHHLEYDRQHHSKSSRLTRLAKRNAGQLLLEIKDVWIDDAGR